MARSLILVFLASCIGQGRRENTAQVGYDAQQPAAYANGRIICGEFLSLQQGATSRIVSFDPHGSSPQVHLDADFNTMPSYSEDGTRFLYVSNKPNPKTGQSGIFEIWEYDLTNHMTRPLTTSSPGMLNHTPAYSHDRMWITFSRKEAGESHKEVWVMDNQGGNLRKLTTTTVLGPFKQGSHHASWSPDGKKMVYASTQSGSTQIWKMNSDGSERRQLTDGLGVGYPHANVPSFSWDGSKIVFWAGIEANYGEVWVMNADGTQPRQVTETVDPGNSDDPFLSPDNKLIIFGSHPTGVRSMLMQAVGGGTPVAFPNRSEIYSRCSWQPLSP